MRAAILSLPLVLVAGCLGMCNSSMGGGAMQEPSIGGGAMFTGSMGGRSVHAGEACDVTCLFQLFAGNSGYTNLPNGFDFGDDDNSFECTTLVRYHGSAAGASTWTAETGDTLTKQAGTPTTGQRGPFTATADTVVAGDGTAYYESAASTTGDITTQDFAIEAVVYMDTTTSNMVYKRDVGAADFQGHSLIDSSGVARFSVDDGPTVVHADSAALSAGWYHIIAFADRSWSSGGRVYVNGALSGTPADITTVSGSITSGDNFALMAGATGGSPMSASDAVAFVAVYDCSTNLTTTAADYLTVAEERFARVNGTFADKVSGTAVTAVPTSFGASTVTVLDVLDPSDNTGTNLFQMGTGWPRFVRRADSASTIVAGYLSESQATNLVTHSSEFDNAAWTKTNATIGADATATPFLDSRADTITDDATSGQHKVSDTVTTSSSTSYVFSVYAKDGASTTADYMQLAVNNCEAATWAEWKLSDGTLNRSGGGDARGADDVGDGWYRYWLAYTDTTGSSCGVEILASTGSTSTYVGDSSVVFSLFGAQFEARGDQAPSSLIPTSGASATRNADALIFSASGNVDETKSTMVARFLVDQRDIPSARQLISANDDSAADRNVVSIGSSDQCQLTSVDGSVTQASIGDATTDIADGARHTCAEQFSANDFEIYVDGVNEGTNDTGGTMPADLTDINIGTRYDEANVLDGVLDEIRLHNVIRIKE